MNLKHNLARITRPKTTAGRLTTACATKLLPLLLLLALPAVVQAQFNYTTNNGTITITGHTGLGGSVTIPGTINGLPVTSIGGEAFFSCTHLTSVTIPTGVISIGGSAFESCSGLTGVTIPDSVTIIGNSAFAECSSLAGVTIPNSVTSIGGEAFGDCTSLTNVTIGNGVTSIGQFAFSGCTSLTNLTIPSSVTFIGLGAFGSCTRLTAIMVDALNAVYSSVDGVLFDKSQTTLIECPGGKAASYTIPNSVTSIGCLAFSCCTRLTNVTIGNSITSIPEGAFCDCSNLTSVSIGNSVTNIHGTGWWPGAFEDCTSLTSITIPNSVTFIGSGAFDSCTSLTAITVDVSNPVYSSVDGVLFNKNQTTLIQYPAGKAGSQYTIPNSVTRIAADAFYDCSRLTSATIPSSVTSIGAFAFSGCTRLTAIMVDALNAVYSSVDGVLFDKGQTTLVLCPVGRAGSYTVPTSVTSIGDRAFASCSSLTNVTIGNSVTSIEDSAFLNCPSLTGVYFKGNAPSLSGDYVFAVDDIATVYYLPGTTGWASTLGGLPTALWVLANPLILNSGTSFGVQTNGFGFIISWARNVSVVVEASTNLANPIWTPLATNTLVSGSAYFSDPQWTNYPRRFYRLRWP